MLAVVTACGGGESGGEEQISFPYLKAFKPLKASSLSFDASMLGKPVASPVVTAKVYPVGRWDLGKDRYVTFAAYWDGKGANGRIWAELIDREQLSSRLLVAEQAEGRVTTCELEKPRITIDVKVEGKEVKPGVRTATTYEPGPFRFNKVLR